jgi:acetyl-CoA C-acetyltransferase
MNLPENPVILAGSRTAFSQYGGVLRDVPATKLGAIVIQNLLNKPVMDKNEVTKIIMGQCIPAVDENVPERQVVIESGLPVHIPSLTINRACCSFMTAVGLAFKI